MSEHENWVRYHSLVQAHAMGRLKSLDSLLEDAGRIAKFILKEPASDVVSLVKKEEQ